MFALLVWEFATLGSILFQLDTVVKNLPMDAYLSESVANVVCSWRGVSLSVQATLCALGLQLKRICMCRR